MAETSSTMTTTLNESGCAPPCPGAGTARGAWERLFFAHNGRLDQISFVLRGGPTVPGETETALNGQCSVRLGDLAGASGSRNRGAAGCGASAAVWCPGAHDLCP